MINVCVIMICYKGCRSGLYKPRFCRFGKNYKTDNHASTSPLSVYRLDALPISKPTASMHWIVIAYVWFVYSHLIKCLSLCIYQS